MAAAKNLKRVLVATMAILLGIALLGPPIAAELLYRYGLRGLDPPPPVPAQKGVPPIALTAYWVTYGGKLPMKSAPIWVWHWPWWIVRTRASTIPRTPGEHLAVQAARVWVSARPVSDRGPRWTLAFWSATLWMSRNRTAEATTAVAMDGAWYGRGARGLDAAANAYFAKSAAALDLHELALLVGLTQSPRRYDPDCSPEQAKARRKYVLDRLLDAQIVSLAEHDDAAERPPGVLPRECRRERPPGAHLAAQLTSDG